MIHRMRGIQVLCLTAAASLAAACGGASTSEPDRVATGVAEARAISATLTAEAPTVASPTPEPATHAPATSEPATQAPPTATRTLPTATQPRPTNTVPPPTQTPTPQDEADTIVPAFGTAKGLEGEIVLHGYTGPAGDTPVFQSSMSFRLRVHDPAVGPQDGAGIDAVEITITNLQTGEVVHERTERQSGYCAFGGGEPICNVFVFAENSFTWSKGQPVDEGLYEANMVARTQNPDTDSANWRFTFEVRLP